MVVYRIGKRLVSLFVIEFAFVNLSIIVTVLIKQYIVMLVFFALLLYLIIGFVDLFSMKYTFTEDFIRFKSTTRDNMLNYCDIKKVKKLKPGLFMKFEVGFYSGSEKIVITGYTANSKKLILDILKKCEMNCNIDIDNSVYELVSKC